MIDDLPQDSSSFAMYGHIMDHMKQYEECKKYRKKAMELNSALWCKWNYIEVG